MGFDSSNEILTRASEFDPDHNRRLWAYGLMYVNADHTQIDWVPFRTADFHLNALNLMENGPCYDCVTIQKIEPKGNGVIDVDVALEHPFPGLLKYTGFDVKGIIMFNGSVEISGQIYFKLYFDHPELCPIRFNLAIAGDWELLNEDGFTIRWSPAYESGEEWPMFNYVEGNYSNGPPNSNINAYINFYTHEERHMFMPGYNVVRTYRIQTQPGPMTLGYAVEACWEPPTVTPVTDPLTDFPPTANQSEPYLMRFFLNDDKPITKPHTEIYEYPVFVQYREWDTGNPNNASSRYWPMSLVGGKWTFGPLENGGGPNQWRYGPQPDTEDIYRIWCSPCETYTAFGKYNGYRIWLRFTWFDEHPWVKTNFCPTIHVTQVDIPGNDPPGG